MSSVGSGRSCVVSCLAYCKFCHRIKVQTKNRANQAPPPPPPPPPSEFHPEITGGGDPILHFSLLSKVLWFRLFIISLWSYPRATLVVGLASFPSVKQSSVPPSIRIQPRCPPSPPSPSITHRPLPVGQPLSHRGRPHIGSNESKPQVPENTSWQVVIGSHMVGRDYAP